MAVMAVCIHLVTVSMMDILVTEEVTTDTEQDIADMEQDITEDQVMDHRTI